MFVVWDLVKNMFFDVVSGKKDVKIAVNDVVILIKEIIK